MASGTIKTPPIGIEELGLSLASGTDLNSITTFGRYYGMGTYTNAPISTSINMDLYVFPRSINSRAWQQMYVYYSTGNRMFYRAMTSESQWGTWQEISTPVFKTYLDTKTRITTANAWEYNGKSFVIPTGKKALIYGTLRYSTGRPLGFGVDTSSTASSPTRAFEASTMYNSCTFLLSAGTWYTYEKRGSVPTTDNDLFVYGIEFTL